MAGRLDPVRKAMLDGAEKGVRAVLEDLLGHGQRDAPIEEGTLRGSGSVEIDRRHDAVRGRVKFSTPYAAKQHEELTYEHPRGGKAKYVEDPLKAMLPRYQGAIGAAVRRELEELER